MRINNIVFSGVMATILASVVGVASAATVNLASKTYVDDALARKQNILTAGEGIEISDNVVKSTLDESVFVKKTDIPFLTDLVTRSDLKALEGALQAEIAAKHAAGDYATAAQLQDLKNTVDELQAGSADKVALESLQELVAEISADYAKKSQLDKTEQDLRSAIDAVDAAVKAINSSNYVTVDDLDAKLLPKANVSALNTLKSELEAAIDEKQQKGEYLEAEDLTAINTAISNLESGMADVATVTALQTAINNLGNTYATKTDLTDAEIRLQNAISAIEIPSVEGLAEKSYVDEELAKKVSVETIQNLEQNITNNYLSKTDAQNTYVTEQQVTQQITNVVGSAESGLLKDVADNKAAIATKADKSALETAVTDLNAKIEQAVIDYSNIDLGSYAKSEDVAKTYATIETVEAVEGRVDALETAGYQTAQQVQGAITTATADLVTESELGSYAKAETVNAELAKKANTADLKALAYKDTVATADIDAKAVTMDKIAGRTPAAGETLLMSVDAEGNVTWLSVEILK